MAPSELTINVRVRRIWLAILWVWVCRRVKVVSPSLADRMAEQTPKFLVAEICPD
jgi:hypothetical protein